jgi:hypothetical protein
MLRHLFFVICALLIAACEDESSSTAAEDKKITAYLEDNGVSDANFINCILDNHPNLTVPKIDTVIGLNCNHEIYSIEGVEIFSNLENIRLTGNHIAQVDVTYLPRLKTIQIENDDSTVDILAAAGNAIEYVYLENLPITEFALSDYPNLKSLYLLSLNLNSFEANSNASIDEININKSALPSMIFAFLKVRKLTITDSSSPQIVFSNLSFVDYLSSINSSIDQLEFSDIAFTRLLDFNSSSIKTLTLGNIKYVQTLIFSDNQIQTVNLDSVAHIGSVTLEGNPLLLETQAYLDSLTDLNVTY